MHFLWLLRCSPQHGLVSADDALVKEAVDKLITGTSNTVGVSAKFDPFVCLPYAGVRHNSISGCGFESLALLQQTREKVNGSWGLHQPDFLAESIFSYYEISTLG